MTSFYSDTFTDSDGTDLTAHGAGWTRNGSVSSNAAIITSNRSRASTANVRIVYYPPGNPADADYSCYGDLYVASNVITSRGGLVVRLDATADTFYFLRYDGTLGWQLGKRVAGTQTINQSVSATLTVGVSYRMELRINGTTLNMWVDGVQVGLDWSDSSISAAGHPGVFLNAVVPGAATDYHVDNFDTDDTPGGGGGAGSSVAGPMLMLMGVGG